jgi:hypothetical protein
MSTDNDVARSLRSWLQENRHEDADRVLDAVFDQVPATPQRRASWLAQRFYEMNGFTRFATVAVGLLAIVIVGLALAKGANIGGPGPTAVPTPTPPQLNTLPTGDLPPGSYEIDAIFPVRLSFSLPAGFTHGRGASDGVGIQSGRTPQHGIEFQIASNVFPDPCHRTGGAASPPIGPTVDDLVTAMTTLVGFEAGPVTDVTIGGTRAKAFDLTNAIDPATCDAQDIRGFIFAGGGQSSIGSGQRERIYVMDVAGKRLMIMTYYFPNGDPAAEADAAASLKKIVESIHFL